MLSKLIAALQNAELEMTAEEIADMLWLALQMDFVAQSPRIGPEADISDETGPDETEELADQLPQKTPPPSSIDVHMNPRYSDNDSISHLTGLPFRSPAASALPDALSLARALRPFMHRLSSKTKFVFNENATVQTIAETHNNIWLPILDPAPVRWFDIALVIDEGASMMLWKDTIVELRALLEHLGAFRDVRVWRLATDDRKSVQLYAETGFAKEQRFAHNPKELIDPSGRRLILVVTDCISLAWHSGGVQQLLDIWGKKNLVTLIQMLPHRLWHQTALDVANTVQISASLQEIANASIKTLQPFQWFDEDISFKASFPVPVVTLEPKSLLSWSRIITGSGGTWIAGKVFEKNLDEDLDNRLPVQEEPLLSARKRVQLFNANASHIARKLAGLLAAAPVPVSLQVIRLIRQTMLPQAGQVHIAEVLLSGLLEEIYRDEMTTNPDHVEYDFIAGIREELLNAVPIPDGQRVLREISTFIGLHYGQTRDFLAIVATQERSKQNVIITGESRPFAQIAATVLRRFGGDFASLAKNLEKQVKLLENQSSSKKIETKKTLEPSQTYSSTTSQEPTTSNKAFLSKIWCDLNWAEWISFDSDDIKTLPTGSGVYRIRAVGGNELFYIGHTGRNLRERIGDLIRNTMRDSSQMPFSDPHTAAPSLWAWRDATGISFECSACPLTDTFSEEEREALVNYLLWQYRLEQGKSTLCNYGRIHPHYVKSGNRSTGRRGYRLPEGQLNNDESPSFPPLRLAAMSHEKTWMGLEWSDFYQLDTTTGKQDIIVASGVYKILDTDTKQLLFIGYSANLRTIFQTQARKNWLCPNPSFAFSVLPDGLHSHQVAEIESDLIGGYYAQTKIVPIFQFKNYRTVIEETLSEGVSAEAFRPIDVNITNSNERIAEPIEQKTNTEEVPTLEQQAQTKEHKTSDDQQRILTGPGKIDLVDLATALEEYNLNNQKVALILGARTGALFRSQYFKKVMSQYNVRSFADLSPYESFAECFTILQREKQSFGRVNLRIMLDKALEDIQNSFTEVCLAELVQLKVFKTLITTSADNLLENAFQTLQMTEHLKGKYGDRLDYLTFTPVRHSTHDIAFHENLEACKLIKINDDVPTFIYNLFLDNADRTNSQFIKRLLGLMGVKHLLIVGVDLQWDKFLLSALPDTVETIWFVNEDEAVMQTFYQTYLGRVGVFRHIAGANGNYDKFLRMLYWQLTEGVSPAYYELSRELTEKLLNVEDEQKLLKKDMALPLSRENTVHADILLITVTSTEADAVLTYAPDTYTSMTIGRRTYFDLGVIGGNRTLMVRTTGQGSLEAFSTVKDGIEALTPQAVIMVGTAFGYDKGKQQIGDIMVATQIQDYDLKRVGSNATRDQVVHLRGSRVATSQQLVDRFINGPYTIHISWPDAPAIHAGLILSGSSLVNHKEDREQLRQAAPNAIGGEMEGAGLLKAAMEAEHKVDWILIKAISDWADGSKNADGTENQQNAAGNAARFTFHVIQQPGFLH